MPSVTNLEETVRIFNEKEHNCEGWAEELSGQALLEKERRLKPSHAGRSLIEPFFPAESYLQGVRKNKRRELLY
jgi:hypothetical protein